MAVDMSQKCQRDLSTIRHNHKERKKFSTILEFFSSGNTVETCIVISSGVVLTELARIDFPLTATLQKASYFLK